MQMKYFQRSRVGKVVSVSAINQIKPTSSKSPNVTYLNLFISIFQSHQIPPRKNLCTQFYLNHFTVKLDLHVVTTKRNGLIHGCVISAST